MHNMNSTFMKILNCDDGDGDDDKCDGDEKWLRTDKNVDDDVKDEQSFC